MFPGRGGPPGSSQVEFSIIESCDRLKKEFSLLQQQCQSLKFDCEKLAQEKLEVHRQYVMYYEMSYGLNVEMHRQSELAKRYLAICHQMIPCLSQEQQNQVAATLERAKQVTVAELNAIIGQQMHAQGAAAAFPHGHPQASHLAALSAHAAAASPFGLPGAGGLPPGLLGLPGAAAAAAAAQQAYLKDEKDNIERIEKAALAAAAAAAAASSYKRTSRSPHVMNEKNRGQSRSPFDMHEAKKMKREEESDDEKSDGDLVVDDTTENDRPFMNGLRSPHENGDSSKGHLSSRHKGSHHDDNSRSPPSDTGSARSTPSQKGSEKNGPNGNNHGLMGSGHALNSKSSSRSANSTGVRHSPKLPRMSSRPPFAESVS